MNRAALVLLFATVLASTAVADVKVPTVISDRMVLQRDKPVPVWGWADPGEAVTVEFAGQKKTATAGPDGAWKVALDPMPASAEGRAMSIAGKNRIELQDVLVGEVWLCSGQSNMQWSVSQCAEADLEIAAGKHPLIRLITVPQVASQKPLTEFKGQWEACTPQTVGSFSAVGYSFGRQLHLTLGVPVGLIDNSWGGSAAEAWVRRDVLEKHDRYAALLKSWDDRVAGWDEAKAKADHAQRLQAWEAGGKKGAQPRPPQNPEGSNHRPSNLYNGVLNPVIGYGIRGTIWYQGESNAGRAYQYRDLFPLLIRSWRDAWGQGDFPFYWVQLADFMAEKPEPAESAWAELREAQTMTMAALPNTGEAVIIDVGEGKDIHPRNKQTVGLRLARWALAKDYGMPIAHRSPTFKSVEKKDGKLVVTFDHVGQGLYAFDVQEVRGCAIAGEDRRFVWAQARIVGKDKIEVWSDAVKDPVAVRYAWADNPVCNLYSREGLPATPFRSDDWPGVTSGKEQ
ncbi:MAG TPA: sialate O-acetylesterase [Planctomycetota bacterium]|nr:sialate O-acetylesterase [Planctomycetota bacterium]